MSPFESWQQVGWGTWSLQNAAARQKAVAILSYCRQAVAKLTASCHKATGKLWPSHWQKVVKLSKRPMAPQGLIALSQLYGSRLWLGDDWTRVWYKWNIYNLVFKTISKCYIEKKKPARSDFAAGSGFIGNIGYSGWAARFYEPVTDPSKD